MFARTTDRYFALAGALLAVATLCATLGMACGSTRPARRSSPAAVEDTSLGFGDTFDVRVFGMTELSGTYRVASDGTIDFPLVGRLEVAGLEPPAVAALVSRRLREGEFLVSPSVSVLVKEYASKRISVMGQVSRPGQFPMQMGLTLVEAISLAGGFTTIADDSQVTVVRREHLGRLRRFVLDVEHGEADEFYLRAGDSVRVPQSVF